MIQQTQGIIQQYSIIQTQQFNELLIYLTKELFSFNELFIHSKNKLFSLNELFIYLMDELFLLHPFLVIIYNAFIRPHFDYGDIIYDQANKESFHQKLESIQYNDALAITDIIWSTSPEKLYQKLSLEFLQKQHRYRKLFYFFKISKGQSLDYLCKIFPI